MTIACVSANAPTTSGGVTAPIGLTAQSMTITPSATPCYDPCTVAVTVTWINETTGPLTGQTVGISVDGQTIPTSHVPAYGGTWSTTTGDVTVGATVSYTFAVTGMMHTASNLICPVPN